MLLAAVRAEAQTPNWVNPDEAKTRLVDAVNQQHNILGSTQPGTNDYANALVRAYYFKAIFALVSDGTSVSQAVNDGLGRMKMQTANDPNLPAVDSSNPGQDASAALVQEATDLLTD
jgi:hypothetical protein